MGAELDLDEVAATSPLAMRELAELRDALVLMTHKLLTCGVIAHNPDASLGSRGCYAGEWNSPQAQDVRKLRAERDALQARIDGAPVGIINSQCLNNSPMWDVRGPYSPEFNGKCVALVVVK